MSTLKVATIKDLANTGGFSLNSGTITANGTLTVSNLVINGTISGSNKQYLPTQSGNSGKFLTTDGSSTSWASIATDAGPVSIQWFNGNSTWNRPTGVKRIIVHLVGGGGGGSGYAESGGAGGYSTCVLDVQSISSVSITIGGRGGGTWYSNQGGRGGTTSFGPYLSADGGYGANQHQQHAGGGGAWGGSSSTQGAMHSHGGGGDGHDNPSGIGRGGASFFGGAGAPGHNWQQFNRGHQDHCAWGSGGSSARNQDQGSDGRQGAIVVYEFK
jgi:hypothetical protein